MQVLVLIWGLMALMKFLLILSRSPVPTSVYQSEGTAWNLSFTMVILF